MVLTGHHSIIVYGQISAYSQWRLERYDPDDVSNEDLGPQRQRVGAALIGIGDDIYFIGGRLWRADDIQKSRITKFNIRTRRMTPATSLSYPRWKTACCNVTVRIAGDRDKTENGIIICGGEYGQHECKKIVELFIPQQNRISRLPSMQISRSAGAAVALPDGRVFVAGGRDERDIYCGLEYPKVEFCNLHSDWQTASASEFWHDAAPMIEAHSDFAMAYFKGRLIAAGGRRMKQSAELFSLPDLDHPLGQWTLLTPFITLITCSSLLVCNDRLFAFGGYFNDSIEELNASTDISSWRWTIKRASTENGSCFGAMTVLL
uniref:Kelch-like protein 18 n=2 Tax=Schistocephalus solidus TaxID=70667 RepID=A0A0V0J7D9_SCHSO